MKSLRDELSETIKRSLVEAGLAFDVPVVLPPHAMCEERVVLSSVLCGAMRAKYYPLLKAAHFYSPMHRWLWVVLSEIEDAGLVATDEAIELAFEGADVSTAYLLTSLADLRENVPTATGRNFRMQADQIVEAWQRRELCRELERIVSEVRTGGDLGVARSQMVDLCTSHVKP